MESFVPDGLEGMHDFAAAAGLAFNELGLLRTALTHRSYLNEHPALDWEDNERLEFLGDAVLDFLLAEHLFRRFPGAPEGELTALRSALVRRETLAALAGQLGAGKALFMGHGEADTGGRERPATLCAAFEALVGALYLDQGLQPVAAWVLPKMDAVLAAALDQVAEKDPKSRLQELAQKVLGVTPRYRTTSASGPDHAKVFTVEVRIGESVCGVGEGLSKQAAAQEAAEDALAHAGEWLAAQDASPASPDLYALELDAPRLSGREDTGDAADGEAPPPQEADPHLADD